MSSRINVGTLGSNACLECFVQSICLVDSMVVKVLLYLGSLRSAVARAVWSKKLPMTSTLALLFLLDHPWGSDPAFFIIWNRFRQFRRYLAYRPHGEARIFRLLDCASAGSPGHLLIHLLILLRKLVVSGILSRLFGFVLVFLFCVCCLALFSIFVMLSGRLCKVKLLLIFANVRDFGEALALIFVALINCLSLPICGNETKCCFRAILSEGVWNAFLMEGRRS